jgi:hypothetical protein
MSTVAERLYPAMADPARPSGVTLNERTIATLDIATLDRLRVALSTPVTQAKPAAKADAKIRAWYAGPRR